MVVVDASVLVTALGDDGADRDQPRGRLRGERLAVPELVDPEVASVLRRLLLAGLLPLRRAELAMSDLAALALRRVPYRPPLPRLWQLRQNLTVYDAVYVALAELLGTTLLTADSRLAGAPGLGCEVELVAGRRCRREAGNAKHCAQ